MNAIAALVMAMYGTQNPDNDEGTSDVSVYIRDEAIAGLQEIVKDLQ